jgi:very-short-patch-repair endonuclease
VVLDVAKVLGPEGWATWDELTARVDRKTVLRWTAAGALVRLEQGVYASAAAATEWRTRVEAAVRSRGAVASHRTALALWGLAPPGGPVHLSVERGRSNRGSGGVVLHRTAELADAVRRVDGVAVTCAERAIVEAWGRPAGLSRAAVRAAAITAVRRRLCGPRELMYELARRPQLPARAGLWALIQLLADGCQSELEIWGCLNVLRAPGMPPFTQQHAVVVAGRRVLLDAAYEEVLLAVEMDGAAWHGSREQREKDIRRDALVATVGWQTLRFSYARMTGAPAGCQADIRSAYEVRLRMFHPDRFHPDRAR